MGINQGMREDWNARAAANAMHYIDTRRDIWDAETFYKEGRSDAHSLIDPVLERLGFDPSGKRLLEIGCGIGRLFPGFAELFSDVWGIDISPEMVQQGQGLCPVHHARFFLGNGEDLHPITTASVDYCFSYIVFQHIPSAAVVWKYLDEVQRVLRPGGCFQLHFRASTRLQSRVVLQLPQRVRSVVKYLRRQPLVGDMSTWTGVAVSPQHVVAKLSSLGLAQLEILPCSLFDHKSFWVIGRQPLE